MMIKISDERGQQLRAYAEAHGLGYGEAIGALLKDAGAAASVPGFSCIGIEPTLTIINLRIDSFDVFIPAKTVLQIAGFVEECAGTAGAGGRRIKLVRGDEEKEIIVARHRRHSIAIIARDLAKGFEVRRVLTLDLARDLVEQLRSAVRPA